MRTLTDHIVNPCNDKIEIRVTDEPGSGGANHRYEISGVDYSRNPSQKGIETCGVILFQNGPIPENGTNVITQEVLLAIVAHRLRTLERMRRGVEGTLTV